MLNERQQGSIRGGPLVILALGLLFAAILVALVLFSSRRPATLPPPASDELYVVPSRLRVRTQPKTSAPVIETIERQAQVRVVEDEGVWVKVRTASGAEGWVERSQLARRIDFERRAARAKAILKLPPLDGMVLTKAPLYAGPGFFYPVVGELKPEAKVRVYTRDHDFYVIGHGDEIAYVEVDAVDLAAAGAEQFDVAAEPVQDTTRIAEAPAAPLPMPEPIDPEPEPAIVSPAPIEPSVAGRGGVFAVVPPGGSQPRIVSRVQPRYPRAARMAGIEGIVVLRGIVRRNGRIDEVQILRDLPQGLGEAARDAVVQWRFEPAKVGGEPIDVYYTVTVRYRLRE